jgi:hypothetical protein
MNASVGNPPSTPRANTSSVSERVPKLPYFEYDVCLSFASEQRLYVRDVYNELYKAGISVFFDEEKEAMLWGKHLNEELDDVYRKRSRFCVMFISREYDEKMWTNFERRSAQARAIKDRGTEYLLPARFDDTEISGLNPSILYVDLRNRSPAQFAALILAKLKPFLPPHVTGVGEIST